MTCIHRTVYRRSWQEALVAETVQALEPVLLLLVVVVVVVIAVVPLDASLALNSEACASNTAAAIADAAVPSSPSSSNPSHVGMSVSKKNQNCRPQIMNCQ